MSNQHTLHFIMQAIHETLHLLCFGVNIIRCIPGELSELVQIPNYIFASLAESAEFILLPLDQSTGDVLLAKTGLEVLPVNNMIGRLKRLSGFLLSSCRPREVVSRIENFLVVANRSNLQVVLDGAKPIISFERMSSLREGRWIGLLKITQSRPLISTIFIAIVVVVVGAKISGKLLQCSEMSLSLLSGSLTLLHDEPKQLGRGRFRGWWR